MGGTETNGKDAFGPLWWGNTTVHINSLNKNGMKIKWRSTIGIPYSKFSLDTFCKNDKEKNCVYIISLLPNMKVLYVGSGQVSRLWDHWKEATFIQYKKKYLLANYALIDGNNEDVWLGIEKYLADKLQPFVGERHPKKVDSIEVNLPDYYQHSNNNN